MASDAITELRALREWVQKSTNGWLARTSAVRFINARIAELEAAQAECRPGCTMVTRLAGDGCDVCNPEAQQAEPSDAEWLNAPLTAQEAAAVDAATKPGAVTVPLDEPSDADLKEASEILALAQQENLAHPIGLPKHQKRLIAVALMRRGRGDQRLRELARDVANSGVSFDDERLKYVEVQIDRETWDELRAALGGAS